MSIVKQLKRGNRFVHGKGHELDGQYWGTIESHDMKTGLILVDLSDGRRVEFERLEIFAWISQGELLLEEDYESV